jgi:4-amino-4-deoxy-L-arabinose transferase-like glycosyltransferase
MQSDATLPSPPTPSLGRAGRLAWNRQDLRIVGLLVLVMAAGALVMQPLGDFPLNDDWAFGLPVKWLVERGRLEFTDWQAMTLIGQVALGGAVTHVTGFSFSALRVLVLVLGAATVVLTYALARSVGSSRMNAAFAAALLMCNPIFVTMSASFMTDVPFLFSCVLAMFLFATYQAKRTLGWLVLAWLAVLLACSIRQLGIAVAFGFVACRWTMRGADKHWWRDSVLPTVLMLGALVAFPQVLKATIGVPSLYSTSTDQLRTAFQGLLALRLGYIRAALEKGSVVLMYTGLCLAPWLLLTWQRRRTSRARISNGALLVALAALVTAGLHATGKLMPLALNTLIDMGLGVRTLPGEQDLPQAPPWFWALVTWVAVCAVLAGLAALPRWLRSWPSTEPHARGMTVLLLVTAAFYNVPFLFMSGSLWFDRYVLLNIAIGAVLLARCTSSPIQPRLAQASALVLAASFVFSIIGTHDYLEWNRQRWAATLHAESVLGASPEALDGGFEYNNFRERLHKNERRPAGSVTIERPDAKYRISLAPLDHHAVVKVFEAQTWLPTSPTKIYLLEATR